MSSDSTQAGAAPAKRGLGRGLAALIPEAIAAAGGTLAAPENKRQSIGSSASETLRFIELRSITLNPRQPRKTFGRAEIDELTESIKQHGVLQPIVVRTKPDNGYELIAGERRFRASCAAGLKEIPAVVREGLDGRDSLALALIENIQREDLDPIETAHAYQELLRDHGMTQVSLAQEVGKSQPQVANSLRLLTLPEAIQQSLQADVISEGHAKVILSVGSEEQMVALWNRIVDESLTVREAERAAARIKDGKPARPRVVEPASARDPQLAEISQRLSLRMGAKVRLVPGRGQRGVIEIAYYDHEHLEGLIEKLAH